MYLNCKHAENHLDKSNLTSVFWRISKKPTHYEIKEPKGLTSGSIALGEQIAVIDKRQCLKYLGRLSREETDEIREAALYGLPEGTDLPETMEAP